MSATTPQLPVFSITMEARSVRPLVIGLLDMAAQLFEMRDLDFMEAVRDLHLLEPRALQVLRQKAQAIPAGADWDLSLEEVIVLYTAADLDCKAYFTDFGVQMRRAQVEVNGLPEAHYQEQVYNYLRLVGHFLQEIRSAFIAEEAFMHQLRQLDLLNPYLSNADSAC